MICTLLPGTIVRGQSRVSTERAKVDSKEKQRSYQLEKYHRRMSEARKLLGGRCVVCGTTEDLEFDHIDPMSKLFTIAHGYARTNFFEEVRKCQLLCSAHHIKKTGKQGDNPTTVSGNEGIHGTGYTYTQKGCRCVLCRTWRSEHRKGSIAYSEVITKPSTTLRKFGEGIDHGTYAGYKKECRLKVPRCEPCKQANREYMRNRSS